MTQDAQNKFASAEVIEFVSSRYVFKATPSGDAFALPCDGPQLPIMLGQRGGKLIDATASQIWADSKIVVTARAIEDAFRVLIAQARAVGERVDLHLRVAQTNKEVVLDLGRPASAEVVVVTRDGWSVRENPPPGVYFRRTSATRALPEPVPGALDKLRELISFAPDDERWALVRGWLVAALFPQAPRPMLLLLGAPGSAKTTRGKLIVNVLDPRAELGGAFGKNLTDDQTKALGRYLVSYDNLSGGSDNISDHLCRLVTGDEIDRRVLYSDADLVTISYRRTGALTAVTMPALRADALERVVVVGVDRIPEEQRTSEAKLLNDFATHHPEILGGVLDGVATVLRNIDRTQAWEGGRPRMADYFDILHALGRETAEAYVRAAGDAMVEAATADPFVAAVTDWLSAQTLPWRGEPSEAWRAAAAHREAIEGMGSTSGGWWPRTARGFTDALTTAGEPLRAVGFTVERLRIRGRRVVEFRSIQGDAGEEPASPQGGSASPSTPLRHPLRHPPERLPTQVGGSKDRQGDVGDAESGTCLLLHTRGQEGSRGMPASCVTHVTLSDDPALHEDIPLPEEPPIEEWRGDAA